MSELPYTERVNPLCRELDGALDATTFLRTLRAADSQIYTGFEGQPGTLDSRCVQTLQKLVKRCGQLLSEDDGLVVLSGCGTSGRIAYLLATRYNALTGGSSRYDYCMAGGDSAILLSDELPEDDPCAGASDLKDCIVRHNTNGAKTMVVGITCGLSAPYVAGQMAMAHYDGFGGAVILGFNPVALARPIKLKNGIMDLVPQDEAQHWQTFRDCVKLLDIDSSGYCSVINPVLGPEPIAGSSRMKGGSATLAILDTLLILGTAIGMPSSLPPAELAYARDRSVDDVLMDYQTLHSATYAQAESTLPAIMERASDALSKRGHIYYLGCGSSGALGCIDSSEMPDTYGSPFDQVRGFLPGGWGATMVAQADKEVVEEGIEKRENEDGAQSETAEGLIAEVPQATAKPKARVGLASNNGDISSLSPLHRISLEQFMEDVVPNLSDKDCVIILLSSPEGPACSADELSELADRAQDIRKKTCLNLMVASTLDLGELACSSDAMFRIITACADSSSHTSPPRKHSSEYSGSSNITNKVVHIKCPRVLQGHIGFMDYSIKLLTNAVTTYAQAAGRGAVYKSQMIAAGPANDKIYMRMVRLIADNVPDCDEYNAEYALICSIYGHETHKLPSHLEPLKTYRETHISASVLPEACRGEACYIVPVAFLLAMNLVGKGSWTVEEARSMIASEPNIAYLLSKHLDKKTHSEATTAAPKVAPSSLRSSLGSFADDAEYVLGIDIGGTNIRAVAVSARNNKSLVQPVHTVIPAEGKKSPESFEKVLTEFLVDFFTKLSKTIPEGPVAVGVGQPGSISLDGFCFGQAAAFPEWGLHGANVHKSVLEAIKTVWGTTSMERASVSLFDDANSALAAELQFGAARLVRNVAMVTFGTGLGTSVSVEGGLIYNGARGLIEGGHTIITSTSNTGEDPRCPCGQLGCLESLCSGRRLEEEAKTLGISSSELIKISSGNSNKSKKAAEVIEMVAKSLAICFLNSIRSYDPDMLIVGGNPTLAEFFLEKALKHLKALQWHLHDDVASVPIRLASVEESGSLGAAALVLGQIKSTRRIVPRTVLRAAVESDRTALYNVCLRTGDSGDDASHIFSIPALLGSIYVGPYLSNQTQFAFSLVLGQEDEEKNSILSAGDIGGYVLGCLDTLAFNKWCHKEWWPQQRCLCLPLKSAMNKQDLELYTMEVENPMVLSCSHDMHAADAKLDLASCETQDGGITGEGYMHILQQYPSHMHIDIMPQCQGKGYGAIMINRLLGKLRENHSKGVHLQMSSANTRAYRFYVHKLGFELLFKGQKHWILGRKL